MARVREQQQIRDRGVIKRHPRSPLWRLRIWQILLSLGALSIIGRLYYLQIYQGPTLTEKAKTQRQQHHMLVHRGAITDRRGLPLAVDTTRYDVFVHVKLLKKEKEEAARILSPIVKEPESKILKLFNSGYPIITLARHLDRECIDQLQELNWTGVDIVSRPFRQYPEGKLAATLLGYTDMDTKGQGGVEQALQETLTDTGNIPKPQLDGHGRTILVPSKQPSWDITPPLGRHVELTLDNYLQHLAEKELYAMCRHSHALRGSVILADPTNGEILAWANYPTFDPNNYTKFKYEHMKNWSMVDVYQPGSTFKIVTVASGLETGAIKPNQTFYDGGSLTVGNRTIHNHDGGHGTINLKGLFIHSSNIASAMIGMAMTPKQFYDKLSEFGLGKPTGIDLPGESGGILLNYKRWTPIDQATTGFGQGAIAVTPLQLVAAVGVLANNGTWVQPHLIRRVYDPRTGVTEKWMEPKKRKVISPDVAKLVSSLLAQNIAEGTQIAGQVPGYRVAGKTGTAQKVTASGRGYMAGQTIASFIGFLPASNPQLLCLAVIDSPQTDGRWGNTVAGPVFNAVALEAARYLNISPDYIYNANDKTQKIKPVEAPSVKYAAELAHQGSGDAAASGAESGQH
ncbi:MAG TPA: penicillin-binding protein 2 [Candidatus Obscuribacter sp.]|nr:penicillin-binding protein 2 [Candidatus Obscuribacter sp.]HMX46302.1 penicillin-binding protein 2 [Candidatus Obscuribacter sp.]HMY55158.1 penicillin-binding protein 2 [Candidatus Obscuribacter sp.]HNB16001.1 penicillin-binding protein 2 [Candidatus Obscuribacter sp.]HND68948.1 penicillin-binding protein 2 [Candidatus Obscuribacter sp.]